MTGLYDWTTADIHVVQKAPTLQGCILLATFLPNIQSANVCAIQIGGTFAQIIVDSGASSSCASLKWAQLYIAHNVQTMLKKYLGHPLLSCTGQPLDIKGTLKISFKLGMLWIEHDIIIYISHLNECLCGLDILRKYSLIQTKDGIFIEEHLQNNIRQI